jgi:HTH-type transcriptional regulator/antitoxin HigA
VNIKPIRSKKDHARALARIEALWDAAPGTRRGDELDVLTTLVEAYERQAYPIDPPDPIEAIKFRMEQAGMDRSDLEPFIGSRARVSEVLSRKRALSISMIRKLHKALGIPPAVLISEYRLKQRKASSGVFR